MLEDYFFTKNTRFVLWGFFALIVAALIFHAGVVVGSRQQKHPRNAFYINQDPRSGLVNSFMPREGFMESSHGAVGTIATVTLPTFSLTTRGGANQMVYAATGTTVTGGATPDTNALKSGQFIIVIGDPNDTDDSGYLDAHMIRILPAPPQR